MNNRIVLSRVLIVIGLAAMLVGAIDPLEGSFIILPGVGLVALGAVVAKSRYRALLRWSCALVAIGVAAMVLFTWWGGIAGKSGHSAWWAVFVLPYPVGWLMGLVGAVLSLIESWKYGASRSQAMQ